MKTIPPSCPEPESGRKYWRSMDQLVDAPEFQQWLQREFPDGASELADSVTRRSFVKLMAASFVLGGVGVLGTGCRRPEEKILPFGKHPEGYIHGVRGSASHDQSSFVILSFGRTFNSGLRWQSRQNVMLKGFA